LTARSIVRKLKRGFSKKEGNQVQPERIKEGKAVYEVHKIEVPYPVYPFPAPPQEAAGLREKRTAMVEGIRIQAEPPFVARPPPKIGEEAERTSMTYPLIPHYPKEGEVVFSYASLKYSEEEKQHVYTVLEPGISEEDREIIARIKKRLEERLDVDVTQIGHVQGEKILLDAIVEALKSLDIQFDPQRQEKLVYYIKRDTLGLGKIEPLMQDPNIEDISCDGVGISIFVYHRSPRIGTVKTNIVFQTSGELDEFIVRLAQKCNKSISIAEPLLDGTLPDGSRVQATLGSDIARRGSNFTVRKFASDPLTPTHMLKYRTLDSLSLAYLWLAVENNYSILISGGTATGKTSLLNALSLFIRPNLKVVSIEDTSELRLPLQHWIPHVARTPLSVSSKVGEVTLFDLLRASLRQRPDYIILGEVRGKEAFVLFQQMATGHASMATIHAASIPQLVDRLITPPINLPPKLLENIDIVVFLSLARLHGADVRRADSILEIAGVEETRPITREIFSWDPVKDTFAAKEGSAVLRKIAGRTGAGEEEIQHELHRRKKILEWMFENNVYDFREVDRIIQAYHTDPENVLEMVYGG